MYIHEVYTFGSPVYVIANIINDGNELFGLGCQTQLKLTHIIIMITAVVPIVLSKPELKRINKNKAIFPGIYSGYNLLGFACEPMRSTLAHDNNES